VWNLAENTRKKFNCHHVLYAVIIFLCTALKPYHVKYNEGKQSNTHAVMKADIIKNYPFAPFGKLEQ